MSVPRPNRILSDKQLRFISEYLKDQNGTQAAIRAGYSPKTAQQIAFTLLEKVIIRAEVDARLAKIAAKAEITAFEVLRGLKRISDLDIRELYDPIGRLKDVKDWPDHIAKAVAGIKYGKDGEVEIKIGDRGSAWIALGKHLKMFTDNYSVELVDPLPDKTAAEAAEMLLNRPKQI